MEENHCSHGLFVLRRDGGIWSRIDDDSYNIYQQTWAASEDELWTVGNVADTDFVLRWRAEDDAWTSSFAEWDELYGVTRVDALTGSGPEDVWALTDAGLVHFDGDAWTTIEAPIFESPRAMLRVDGELLIDDCVHIWSYRDDGDCG